jgi:hypothetical protein
MAKSTTIWVSTKTKDMANRLKGGKSYNQHYTELMEMFARGELKAPEKPIVIRNETPVVIEREKPVIVEKPCGTAMTDLNKQILIEEIRETVASASLNPLVMEEIRQVVSKEVDNQFWLNYPRYCRNCGYPTISGVSEPRAVNNSSIFNVLV